MLVSLEFIISQDVNYSNLAPNSVSCSFAALPFIALEKMWQHCKRCCCVAAPVLPVQRVIKS